MVKTNCIYESRWATTGWKCVIEHSVPRDPHEPCGLVPRWWNLRDRWKYRRVLS